MIKRLNNSISTAQEVDVAWFVNVINHEDGDAFSQIGQGTWQTKKETKLKICGTLPSSSLGY